MFGTSAIYLLFTCVQVAGCRVAQLLLLLLLLLRRRRPNQTRRTVDSS